MKTNNFFTIAMAITLAVAFTLSLGCKKNNNTNTEIKYVTLGVILPLDQEKGTLRKNALRTAINEINASGGVGSGYEIRLNIKSSQGDDREVAASIAAQNIIAESLFLVGMVTSFSSSSTGVVYDVGIPFHYPIIAGSATASSLSGISPYFQRLCAPDPFEANVLANQGVDYGISSVAIAVEDGDAYSMELAAAFQTAYGSGASVMINFSANDPDYGNKMDQLLANNPEGIFVSMLNPIVYNEFFTVLGNINASNNLANTTYILCDGLYSSDFFQAPIDFILGEVNGHPGNFGAFPSADTTSTEYIYFKEKLYQEFDQDVASYNAQFYDIGYLYALALEKTLNSIGVVSIDVFREMVAENIRPISNYSTGDSLVFPSLGWESIKTITQNSNIDYVGASGNCDIDNEGNAITPYSVFKVIKQGDNFSFEIIKIIP
ncbi:MAG: ABC transporter substrate-binding protein [Bacteroidetes bacterium]|nr:ABC transporter substrate-binding protein [Bacteroidota bacterium]